MELRDDRYFYKVSRNSAPYVFTGCPNLFSIQQIFSYRNLVFFCSLLNFHLFLNVMYAICYWHVI